jgi:hypothetical protein
VLLDLIRRRLKTPSRCWFYVHIMNTLDIVPNGTGDDKMRIRLPLVAWWAGSSTTALGMPMRNDPRQYTCPRLPSSGHLKGQKAHLVSEIRILPFHYLPKEADHFLSSVSRVLCCQASRPPNERQSVVTDIPGFVQVSEHDGLQQLSHTNPVCQCQCQCQCCKYGGLGLIDVLGPSSETQWYRPGALDPGSWTNYRMEGQPQIVIEVNPASAVKRQGPFLHHRNRGGDIGHVGEAVSLVQ